MKLELKHLAPYLPYGLLVLDELKQTQKIIGLKNETYFIENGSLYAYADIQNCNPILKPISDLDKLIRNEFEKYHDRQEYDKEVIDLFCIENGVDEIIENIVISSLPYECVEYMFKNHYDVFDLISQGLAISIHEVNQ